MGFGSNDSLLLRSSSTQDSDDARQELTQQEVQAKKLRLSIARRRNVAGSNCKKDSVEGILMHYEKCLADTETRIETLRRDLGVVDCVPTAAVTSTSAPGTSP